MEETKLGTLFAALLQAHGQRELLVHLLTQEDLRCAQVYKQEELYIRQRRSQALQELVRWLYRMGLEDEMLRLMQQEPSQHLERLRQAQHSKQPICRCVWCLRKRQTRQGHAGSPQEKSVSCVTQQKGGES